jgi:tetratricopeptide (TPR) repeat protein
VLFAAIPAAANARLSSYVEARTADALGDQARAARLFADLARAEPANRDLARRAIAASIDSGDTRLALSVARTLPVAELALDARLLLVADALRRDKGAEALTFIDANREADGGFLAPLLRAWSTKAGTAALANLGNDTLLTPFAAEQRAAILLAARRPDEALAIIPEALANAGGRETRLRLAYAASLASLEKTDQARALLKGDDPALAKLDLNRPQPGILIDTPASGFAELLLGLAVSLSRGDDRALPLTLVQVSRHAAPANSEAAILAALLLARRDRDAEALAALDSVPANDPFREDVLDASARLLLQMNRGPEALTRATAATTAKSASAGDHARLGNILDDLGRHAEAADAYGRAAALAEAAGASNRWSYRLLRASQLDAVDRWPEARAELRAGLAVAPEQPLLLNYLGYGSLERGENLDAAEAMIRRALALRPGDPSITDSLGWALYKRGRLPEAIETLRTAAAAQPAEAEIHEHLCDALFRAGRRYEARFAWRAALVNAEQEEAKRIEAKLVAGWTVATAAP